MQEVLNKVDVVVMPVFNVDGYVYTWHKVGIERTASNNRNKYTSLIREARQLYEGGASNIRRSYKRVRPINEPGSKGLWES